MARGTVVPEQRGLPLMPTIQDRCEEFLRLNPEFLKEFVGRALQLKGLGFKRFSSDAILHGMRYDHAVRTRSTDGWKINNDLSSRLSRLAERAEPTLDGFFEKRTLKS